MGHHSDECINTPGPCICHVRYGAQLYGVARERSRYLGATAAIEELGPALLCRCMACQDGKELADAVAAGCDYVICPVCDRRAIDDSAALPDKTGPL